MDGFGSCGSEFEHSVKYLYDPLYSGSSTDHRADRSTPCRSDHFAQYLRPDHIVSLHDADARYGTSQLFVPDGLGLKSFSHALRKRAEFLKFSLSVETSFQVVRARATKMYKDFDISISTDIQATSSPCSCLSRSSWGETCRWPHQSEIGCRAIEHGRDQLSEARLRGVRGAGGFAA